jgi:hypothetical protein
MQQFIDFAHADKIAQARQRAIFHFPPRFSAASLH